MFACDRDREEALSYFRKKKNHRHYLHIHKNRFQASRHLIYSFQLKTIFLRYKNYLETEQKHCTYIEDKSIEQEQHVKKEKKKIDVTK